MPKCLSFALATSDSTELVLEKLCNIIDREPSDGLMPYAGSVTHEGFQIWTKFSGSFPSVSLLGKIVGRSQGTDIFVEVRPHPYFCTAFLLFLLLGLIVLTLKLAAASRQWIGGLLVILCSLVLFPLAILHEKNKFRNLLLGLLSPPDPRTQ
jgi:hypothetical protein